jgi:hypothetical protein
MKAESAYSGHDAVLVGARNPVATATRVGDHFAAHDGDKS